MPVRERFGRKQFHYDLRRAKTGIGVASTGGGGGSHNLLSVPHADTEIVAPSEGALVLANVTPKWDLLAHPHAAGYAMVTDATTWLIDQTPTWTGRHSWSDGAVQAYVDEDGSADFNGHVAIGANAGVNLARVLNILETAIDTTLSYEGVYTNIVKTAGASDEDDSFTGHYVLAELNQSGGTISYLYGVSAWARITDGQVGTSGAARYLRGLYGVADIDGGIVYDHAIGVHALADHESGATVDGNLVGVYSQVDNDGTVNGSAILLWLDALTGVDYTIYCDDDVPTVHRGAATFGATNLPAAQVDIDQPGAAGAIPVLMLDQGDASEQHIVATMDGADQDFPAILQLAVTGTPTLAWDESDDKWTLTKHLSLLDGDLYLASALGIIHADGVVDGQVLVADGTRYIPGDLSDISGGDAQFVVMALSATLANERVLTGGDGISLTDGGAGGAATVAVDLVAAWSGLEFNVAELQIDQDAVFVWTALHTHQANVVMDDGVTHSPLVSFVGGSNDDTASLRLVDDAVAGNSDLAITLVADDADAQLQINNASGVTQAWIDAIGDASFEDIYIASGKGLIYADSVAAGMVPVADGTRYIPAAANANLPIAPGARGHIIRAEAGPVWASYNAATNGAALAGDGTDIISTTTPTWTGRHSWSDGAVQAYVDEDGTALFKSNVAIGNTTVGGNEFLRVRNTALSFTASTFGINTYLVKTGGASDAADYYYGMWSQVQYNQVGGTIGSMYGNLLQARVDAGGIGDVANARHLYGLQFIADMNGGKVWGNTYGVFALIDQEAGNEVTGDAYGIYVREDMDGTVGGTAYMVFLSGLSNVDYGFYEVGCSANYFQSDTAIGGTVTAQAQLHVDQSSATGAQPALLLDQGDISEQHIVLSMNGADQDFPAILQLNVTGTPTLAWDESEDDWTLTKNLSLLDGNMDIAGHASIGSEAVYQAHQVLNIDEISTSTAVQNVYGAGILLQAEPGANTQTSFQGIHSLVRLDTVQAQTAGQFAGVTGRAEINDGIAGTVLDGMGGSFYVDAEDGTMTTASGAQIWTPHVDNGGVTTGRGAWIRAGVVGGGSVTTLYGLYIDDIAAGGTNWSIYTAGGAHYFGAYTKITQAAAAGAIEVLALQQDDIDKSFVNYLGTSAADQTRSISTVNGDGAVEGPKNFASSAGWAFQGMVRIEINSVEYWMPYYSADTS